MVLEKVHGMEQLGQLEAAEIHGIGIQPCTL